MPTGDALDGFRINRDYYTAAIATWPKWRQWGFFASICIVLALTLFIVGWILLELWRAIGLWTLTFPAIAIVPNLLMKAWRRIRHRA